MPTPLSRREKRKNKGERRRDTIAAPPVEEIEEEIQVLERVAAPPKSGTASQKSSAELEEARLAAWENLAIAIDCVVEEYYGDEEVGVSEETTQQLLGVMETYRTITGEYPYETELECCKKAFAQYLTGGIKPEILEEIRRLVVKAIVDGGRFGWAPLRDAMLRSGRDWRQWHDRELYLPHIAPNGGFKALREAASLGFVDHRLEHAIIMIQRLVRYRNATPPPVDAAQHKQWLMAFEEKHHRSDSPGASEWIGHGVHLTSFAQSSMRFDTDEAGETSFVWWNRQCIPEFVLELARLGHTENGRLNSSEHELSEGVLEVIGAGTWGALGRVVSTKRESLYRDNISFLLEDDALAKTNILIRLHAEGRLGHLRNARRDVLKFVSFQLKEPPPAWVPTENPSERSWRSSEKRFARETPIAKCYLDRLDAMPLSAVEEIFGHLTKCLATRGRFLLQDFAKLDVAALSVADVRKWFLELVIDDCEAVGRLASPPATPGELESFLRNTHARWLPSDLAVSAARAALAVAWARVRDGKPLYEYSIWLEPVSVTPVLLPGAKEVPVTPANT